MTAEALVDTGAYILYINENIQEQLQLPFLEKRKRQMAGGTITERDVVGPVEVKFKNRRTMINALCFLVIMKFCRVLYHGKTWIALIHPQRRELIANPNHPCFAQIILKQVFY